MPWAVPALPRKSCLVLERLRRAIARMSETMHTSGGPWLMGSNITLADVAIMPIIVRLEDLGLGAFWDRLTEVGRWLDAIRARPSFSKAYYFGSLLTEKYPELKNNLIPRD